MKKSKIFAKYFWHGMLTALKGLAFLALLVSLVALVFILVILIAHVGAVACAHFGNWFALIYLLDMIALYFLVANLISMEKPEGHTTFVEFLRRMLMLVLGVVGLFIFKGILWCVGKVPAMLFDQSWSVGFTLCVGLFIGMVVLFIGGMFEYIKQYGKQAFVETIIKSVGFITVITILIAIAFLILC